MCNFSNIIASYIYIQAKMVLPKDKTVFIID